MIKGFQVTNQALHEQFRAEFGLGEAEVETLLTLHRRPDRRAPLNVLSKATAFSTGGFTKIADKLSTQELTARSACSEDRRVTYLELTEKGADVAARLTAFAADTNRAHIVDVIGAERATELANTMTELYRANRSG